ncbi:BtrH N-terminal domain-containing protein [Massilia sp. BJB1822]|uniref:BtrH N-terminal domain-containing protein n=1 Tax=Massilia sp. BJB1822 TaxID=2744470 RepID=UPI001593EE1E|nr:BtrH N-terminal domain-containing protein [Massilia sp. BJB1822]NVD98809.1 DUF4872 domain-containing protein [Massilia sp. BJB1822]
MSALAQASVADVPLALEGFHAQPGVHCESGTLRMMLAHAGIAHSEAMVFGLGQGLDFVIWPVADARHEMPILSGRSDSGELVRRYAANTGVQFRFQESTSAEQALEQARAILAAGQVAGLKLDIFHLPYFSAKRHFCAHYVALHALDSEQAWVVDTAQQGGSHRIALADLARARASRAGQQSSDSLSVSVVSTAGMRELRAALPAAIAGCARNYLASSGSTRGQAGLRTLLGEMPEWWSRFADPAATIMGIANFWEFAGTGGANFRALYRQFLCESQEVLGLDGLAALLPEAQAVEQGWADCIAGLRASAAAGSEAQLRETAARFAATVAREQTLMAGLARLFGEAHP